MRKMIGLLLILILAACSSTPEPAPAATIPPTVTATTIPSSTATWTATAAPTATNTPSPTDLPSPTATASPEPSPTATATATPAPVDLSAYELPLVVAGVTLQVIGDLETTAAGLRDGSLASIEAGGALLGYQIAIGSIAQALDESPLKGRAKHYEEGLRANLRTVYGLIQQWQQGVLSSATIGPPLAAARTDAERVLLQLTDELRRLGVTEEQIDEFMAELETSLP